MSSKEFNAIGLVKKNMGVGEIVEMADKLGVHAGLLALFFARMLKITEKFLEIEKRLAALEGKSV